MSNSKNGCEAVSRRTVLAGSALVLGAAAATATATQAAQQKISKAAAKYQDTPKGNERCDNCAYFVAPNACTLVAGDISPSAWCIVYRPKT